MPANGVLVVDGVFAFRPEINAYWDLRIWVEIDAELSVRRGIERDAEMEGDADGAEALHRDRYLAGELLYIDEVDPRSFVDVIVDNTDFDNPRLVRPRDLSDRLARASLARIRRSVPSQGTNHQKNGGEQTFAWWEADGAILYSSAVYSGRTGKLTYLGLITPRHQPKDVLPDIAPDRVDHTRHDHGPRSLVRTERRDLLPQRKGDHQVGTLSRQGRSRRYQGHRFFEVTTVCARWRRPFACAPRTVSRRLYPRHGATADADLRPGARRARRRPTDAFLRALARMERRGDRRTSTRSPRR